jgi:endonuclease/exonuclease/phosphatase family metal-dependent hydrolase
MRVPSGERRRATMTDVSDTDTSFGSLVESTVRVVTWNLWWRFGPWEARLPAIVETLRRVDPDVVCLQEVWSADGRSSAAVVADALGHDRVEAVGVDLDGIGFGNAVTSRWPIVDHDIRALPSPPEHEEYRTVLRADVDGPRGPMQVFCTHLHWRADHSAVRQDQVREVCRFVAGSPDRSFPAVLAGDLNADPDSDEIRMLVGKAAVPEPPLVFWDAWTVGGSGPGHTWSNANPWARDWLEPERRLDYVLTGFPKEGGRGHCVEAALVGTEPVDGVVPSDHYGVRADLRY